MPELVFVSLTVITEPILDRACWQSGDAADCKSVYTCSIHVHASNHLLKLLTPKKNESFEFLIWDYLRLVPPSLIYHHGKVKRYLEVTALISVMKLSSYC